MAIFSNEQDPAVSDLRTRLDAFYNSTTTYFAFQGSSKETERWGYVREAILSATAGGAKCRVLEIGAGRTGFASEMKDIRHLFHFTAQDVTSTNETYLREQADAVHIGGVLGIEGRYDIIFSTFVFEHISEPGRTFEKLFELLEDNGKLFVFCPRYDFPFYLSHSADHYSLRTRFYLGLVVLWRRLLSLLSRRPLFLIHTDPAVFHMEWTMDRDAIHWASLWDIKMHFKGRARIRTLRIYSPGWKDWLIKNILQINVCIAKRP